MKVSSSKECVPQYRIVIGRLVIPMKPQNKKIGNFVTKHRVWKMKDEDTARLFTCNVAAKIMMLLKLMTSIRSGY